MKSGLRVLLSLILATAISIPPLIAARERNRTASSDPSPRSTTSVRGDQSEPGAPDAVAPQSPALRDSQPRITPFCEFVPETFFITGLGAVTTDLGTAGYVIEASGRYVVTRDLAVPDVDFGILVRAPNVILDLDGHTISDEANAAVLVRMSGAVDLSIRNGALKGGAKGIAGNEPGEWNSPRGWLSLGRLKISGLATGFAAVDVGFVERVGIVDSIIRGDLIIRWGSYGSRIVNSRIEGSIDISEFNGGRLLGNIIDGSVEIGGEGSVIRGNLIRSRTGLAALAIIDGRHFIRDNEIIADGAAHALSLRGLSITQRNILSGGEESTLLASSYRSRISGNVIHAHHVGIAVSGGGNLIESNEIGGDSLACGISFEDSHEKVYRNNLIYGADEPVCGEGATNGGGNGSFPSCPSSICGRGTRQARASAMRLKAVREEDGDLDPAHAGGVRRCEPGEVIMISAPHPGNTPYGTTPLLIDAPGYYLVTQDLHLPDNPDSTFRAGILITSPDVTLDLGGHTIFVQDAEGGVRIVGSENVLVRNGEVRGGRGGLRADGDPGSDMTRIRLERMRLPGGSSSGYSAVGLVNVRYVELFDSRLSGVNTAVWISGASAGRIVGNRVTASKVSMPLDMSSGLVIQDNALSGLHLRSGNLVRRNVNDSPLVVFGGNNRVEENFLEESLNHAWSDAQSAGVGNVLRGNILDGTVAVGSDGATIHGNTFFQGIVVRGSGATLQNNLIVGGYEYCGINLLTDASHRYRDNVLISGGDGICGYLNIDEGGNVVPPPVCGNMAKAVTETCDYYENQTCAGLGFDGGSLRCNATCDGYITSGCSLCGDDLISGAEMCDGDVLGGRTCVTEGLEGGTLACASDCRSLDKSGCIGCGNGILEEGEVCDGPSLGGATCASLGLEGDALRCNVQCNGFELSSCSGCGNGVVEGTEWCDGTSHWSSPTCLAYGFPGGTIGCNADCTVDSSACWRCGNGVREGSEACDGADLGGETCVSLGKPRGTLFCAANCTFNTYQCLGYGE